MATSCDTLVSRHSSRLCLRRNEERPLRDSCRTHTSTGRAIAGVNRKPALFLSQSIVVASGGVLSFLRSTFLQFLYHSSVNRVNWRTAADNVSYPWIIIVFSAAIRTSGTWKIGVKNWSISRRARKCQSMTYDV